MPFFEILHVNAFFLLTMMMYIENGRPDEKVGWISNVRNSTTVKCTEILNVYSISII